LTRNFVNICFFTITKKKMEYYKKLSKFLFYLFNSFNFDLFLFSRGLRLKNIRVIKMYWHVEKMNFINNFFKKMNFLIKISCQELKTKKKTKKSKLITPKLCWCHDFIFANLVLSKIPWKILFCTVVCHSLSEISFLKKQKTLSFYQWWHSLWNFKFENFVIYLRKYIESNIGHFF